MTTSEHYSKLQQQKKLQIYVNVLVNAYPCCSSSVICHAYIKSLNVSLNGINSYTFFHKETDYTSNKYILIIQCKVYYFALLVCLNQVNYMSLITLTEHRG
jgi:hypothetical protein